MRKIYVVVSMFIIFLLVGNLTAPPQVTADVQIDNPALSAFYHIGKFMVVPFQNIKYRLVGGEDYTLDYDYYLNQDKLQSKPKAQPVISFTYPDTNLTPRFKGLPEKYFKDRTYHIVEYKGQVYNVSWKRNIYPISGVNYIDSIQKDFNNQLTKDFAMIMIKLTEGEYPEKLIDKYPFLKERIPRDKFGFGKPYSSPKFYGLPLNDRIMRAWIYTNIMSYYEMNHMYTNRGGVMSQTIRYGGDCGNWALVVDAVMYYYNKMHNINAMYFEMGVNGEHATAVIYYPSTGRWEVYDWFGHGQTYWLKMGTVPASVGKKLGCSWSFYSAYKCVMKKSNIKQGYVDVYLNVGQVEFPSFNALVSTYNYYGGEAHGRVIRAFVVTVPTPDMRRFLKYEDNNITGYVQLGPDEQKPVVNVFIKGHVDTVRWLGEVGIHLDEGTVKDINSAESKEEKLEKVNSVLDRVGSVFDKILKPIGDSLVRGVSRVAG